LPLDLGHDAAWLTPALRLIAEAGVVPARLMRWSPDRASQQIADPALQDIVGRQPDRVGNLLSFGNLVHLGIGEGGIAAEVEVLHTPPVAESPAPALHASRRRCRRCLAAGRSARHRQTG